MGVKERRAKRRSVIMSNNNDVIKGGNKSNFKQAQSNQSKSARVSELIGKYTKVPR